MDESSDALSEAGISMNLTTRYAAQHLCVLSTVDSTNNYLKQRAADLPHGYAVVADCQTAGRGRLGRSFVSPSGSGIYISLLLRPNIPLERMHLMTVGAAIAACEAIQETAGFTPDIKWVNDVLMHGKKLCGILTEASIEAENPVNCPMSLSALVSMSAHRPAVLRRKSQILQAVWRTSPRTPSAATRWQHLFSITWSLAAISSRLVRPML